MTDDFKTSLEDAIKNLAKAIKDAAQMDVITYAYDINKGDNEAGKKRCIAQTEMMLDGDINNYVPIQEVAGELKIHTELYQLHLASVDKATAQRISLLTSAKEMLAELKHVLEE